MSAMLACATEPNDVMIPSTSFMFIHQPITCNTLEQIHMRFIFFPKQKKKTLKTLNDAE